VTSAAQPCHSKGQPIRGMTLEPAKKEFHPSPGLRRSEHRAVQLGIGDKRHRCGPRSARPRILQQHITAVSSMQRPRHRQPISDEACEKRQRSQFPQTKWCSRPMAHCDRLAALDVPRHRAQPDERALAQRRGPPSSLIRPGTRAEVAVRPNPASGRRWLQPLDSRSARGGPGMTAKLKAGHASRARVTVRPGSLSPRGPSPSSGSAVPRPGTSRG
jgi:hypothetical protein